MLLSSRLGNAPVDRIARLETITKEIELLQQEVDIRRRLVPFNSDNGTGHWIAVSVER